MEFKDITILENADVFWNVQNNPSPQTKLFLLNLVGDPYFQKAIARLREKYKIPDNGYSVFKLTEALKSFRSPDSIYDVPEKVQKQNPMLKLFIEKRFGMVKDLKALVNHYNLPPTFIWRFSHLICFNSFINFDNNFYPSAIFGKKYIIERIKHAFILQMGVFPLTFQAALTLLIQKRYN